MILFYPFHGCLLFSVVFGTSFDITLTEECSVESCLKCHFPTKIRRKSKDFGPPTSLQKSYKYSYYLSSYSTLWCVKIRRGISLSHSVFPLRFCRYPNCVTFVESKILILSETKDRPKRWRNDPFGRKVSLKIRHFILIMIDRVSL